HLLCGDRIACEEVIRRVSRRVLAGALACLIESHVHILNGISNRALKSIEQALTLAPDLPVVNYTAGLQYMRLKQWKLAEERFRHAIALDPASRPAHDMLARLLHRSGKNSEAVE